MKFITISLAIFMSLSVSAREFSSFRVENIVSKKASVYLVAGRGGFNSYSVSTVFKKLGTFNSDQGVVEIPSSSYELDGFRSPTHVLVVTHDSNNHALSKVGVGQFEDPKYLNLADRVAPDNTNLKFKQRNSISFKLLEKRNRVFILSDLR